MTAEEEGIDRQLGRAYARGAIESLAVGTLTPNGPDEALPLPSP